MILSDFYRKPSDLPSRLPVFPLSGAILLPRASLPLNIFEPRYLAMIDSVLAGDRLLGMIQPVAEPSDTPGHSQDKPRLRRIGGCGRLQGFQETEDGRYLISLTGVCRFSVLGEVDLDQPFRTCSVSFDEFGDDLKPGAGEDDVDRETLLRVLQDYLIANDLQADWEAITESKNEFLVNTLAMLSPYGAEEKQALVEAPNLKSRSDVLIALAEMELAARDDGSGNTLQ